MRFLNDLSMSQEISGINSFFSARFSDCEGNTPRFLLLLGLSSCCSFFLPHIVTSLIHISFMSLLKYYLIREASPDHPYKLGNNTTPPPAPEAQAFLFPLSYVTFSTALSVSSMFYVHTHLLLSTPTKHKEHESKGFACSFTEDCPLPGVWQALINTWWVNKWMSGCYWTEIWAEAEVKF